MRRSGKTTIARSLPRAEYFDCELPSIRRLLAQPETFFDARRGRTVVLDEIHRHGNPSELLKIAADHYQDVRILATGSSTLGASRRFRDTLTGRKAEVWLTPMMSGDLVDFGTTSLDHRFLRGGLPPFFLAPEMPEREVQEWVDSYWAKDILELFRLERRHSFQRFLELLHVQSGGLFEATRFARDCDVSRTSIANYLAVLEATFVVHVVRPFSSRRATEIVAAPKVYGFDTGFVCHYRGIDRLRAEDFGLLWEHYVLNEIHARLQTRAIRYWRDKRGHEVDFILAGRGRPPVAIECKATSTNFDAANLVSFRKQHPEGANLVVASDVKTSFAEQHAGVPVTFVGLEGLIRHLLKVR
ncbi:MAG: ATP-binding protein [Betaproteobacteria bacterium]|nr:ATP-binding protein [Betaproteobacteria bacterium]MBI2960509.1 ATP-binding protein [Betaproteobacteria bacterium]